MSKIEDLHYIVIKSRGHFVRAAHVVVFYRHDKDGKPFIYDNVAFYGNDGRKTRGDAMRYGRDLVNRKIRFNHYRDTYIRAMDRDAVCEAGLNPEYRG